MKLTIKDRVVILNLVLPQFDTRQGMITKKNIGEKVKLSSEEQSQIISNNLGNGQIDIGFKTSDAITNTNEYEFTDEEIFYMKKRVDYIDKNGMFSIETMDTYNSILDTTFLSEEYILMWNEHLGVVPEKETDTNI